MWNSEAIYTRVKLCWFESLDASYEASQTGADSLGFHILQAGTEDWRAKAEMFRDFLEVLPQSVSRTLLIDFPMEVVQEVLNIAAFDCIQLYPDFDPIEIEHLLAANSRPVKIMKVMSAQAQENRIGNFDQFLETYRDVVDAFLLDSCREGGSGKVGDWGLCREIVQAAERPVFLAGGLHAGNVGEAIRTVRPFGVDVETGVSDRVPGRRLFKNLGKCREFVQAVMRADRELLRAQACSKGPSG